MFVEGITPLSEKVYSDARTPGDDPVLKAQPELLKYMELYPRWRSLYEGTALEERLSTATDPATGEKPLRWPVRFNLVKSYCHLHAGLLWGRGRTGSESNDLFTVKVDPKVPGKKPATRAADRLAENLQYFWSQQASILRSCGVIQQWAGGCIVKAAWAPRSPNSVLGIQLQIIQPEHFYPTWNPLNFEELLAVRIRFFVSKDVAMAKYGATRKQLEQFTRDERVPVEEYWDHRKYYILLGRQPFDTSGGFIARRPDTGEPMQGPNPWKHPVYGYGLIPFQYIPRIRTGRFLGESLAYDLEGLLIEVNKTLADYGDALSRGAHPSFGISDYSGPGKNQKIIYVPKSGALNLGNTTPGGTAAKVHTFPQPSVPPQTHEFTERLLSFSELVAGLTPAARGVSEGQKSGLAIALEMLPTTNLIDWQRGHWSASIAGRGGLDHVVSAMWYNKRGLNFVPPVQETMFDLNHELDYRSVVPRDRIEIIDEVVRLATARAVSPEEWLDRLGDIEDIDEEMARLVAFLAFMSQIEAAVAGRSIEVSDNRKSPDNGYPEVTGKTEEPATKQPAKQPEGQKNG